MLNTLAETRILSHGRQRSVNILAYYPQAQLDTLSSMITLNHQLGFIPGTFSHWS